MGFLYLIKSNEFYKIGIANNVSSRLAQLQTGSPITLEVVLCFEFGNATPVEQSLHQRFSDQRGNGEWFRLASSDVYDLSSICVMLGGKKSEVSPSTPESIEEADKTEEESQILDYDKMIRDGWRVEIEGSGEYAGRYYSWRRGSLENRERVRGGRFDELPEERKLEYLRNRNRKK